jgi:hypothetical protein
MYIIQTNTTHNDDGIEMDFQSYMYQIKKQTWEEFKDYIVSTEDFTEKILQGTMRGLVKTKYKKPYKVIVNDEFHLRVRFTDNTESRYYLVEDEQFEYLKGK